MRKIIALVMVYLIIGSVLSISVLSAKVEVIGPEMGYRVVMSDGSEFFMAYEGFYRYESEANTVVGHLNRGEDLAVFSALVRILYNRQREHGGLGNRLNYYLEDERTLDKSTSLLIANLIRTYYKQNYVKLSENDVSSLLKNFETLLNYYKDSASGGFFSGLDSSETEEIKKFESTIKEFNRRINELKTRPPEEETRPPRTPSTPIPPSSQTVTPTPSTGTSTTPQPSKPSTQSSTPEKKVLNKEEIDKIIKDNFLVTSLIFWNEKDKAHLGDALQKDGTYYRLVPDVGTFALYGVIKQNATVYVWDGKLVLRPLGEIKDKESIIKFLEGNAFKKKEIVTTSGQETTTAGQSETTNFDVAVIEQNPNPYISSAYDTVDVIFSVKPKREGLVVNDFMLGNDINCEKQGDNWKCRLIVRSTSLRYDYVISYVENNVEQSEKGHIEFKINTLSENSGWVNPMSLLGLYGSTGTMGYYCGRVESDVSKSVDRILDVIDPVYKFLYLSCTMWRMFMLIKGGNVGDWMYDVAPEYKKDVKGQYEKDKDGNPIIINEDKIELSSKGELFNRFCEPIECSSCGLGNMFTAGFIKSIQCSPPCLTGARYSLLLLKNGLERGYNACKSRTRNSGFSLFECEIELGSVVCDSMYGINTPSFGNTLGQFSRYGIFDQGMLFTSLLSGGGFNLKPGFKLSDVKTGDNEISDFCKQISTMKFINPMISNFGRTLYGGYPGYGGYSGGGLGYSGYSGYDSNILLTREPDFSSSLLIDTENDKFRHNYLYYIKPNEGQRITYNAYLKCQSGKRSDIVKEKMIDRSDEGKSYIVLDERCDRICLSGEIRDYNNQFIKIIQEKCWGGS